MRQLKAYAHSAEVFALGLWLSMILTVVDHKPRFFAPFFTPFSHL